MTTTLPIPISDAPNFLQQLLEEQTHLTAVERFSLAHDCDILHDRSHGTQGQTAGDSTSRLGRPPGHVPSQAAYYRALLPTAKPQAGEQLSFEVNLDACSGCKSCVVACHTLNGLDEEESWRRVGTLVIGEEQPRVQHVTTACQHCADPGCLNGCPVKAYEKDPITGIVRHLDDQCIGCKYCTMMCPYEVPSYNSRLGIVRKCDMCHQRLAVGEAPACVQACPNEAIAIRLIETNKLQPAVGHRLSPNAPLSALTVPSTRYVGLSHSLLAQATAQDADMDHPAESHWPLALMLVATQASIGLLLVERSVTWSPLVSQAARVGSSFTLAACLAAGCMAAVGLLAASFHLGQPLRAWRVFLGLRTSWLSREAVLFGKYMGLLALAIVLMSVPYFESRLPEGLASTIPSWGAEAALWMTLAVGLAAVFSSGMIYIVTRRELWRATRTFGRMLGSGLCLGLAGAGTLMAGLNMAGVVTNAPAQALSAILMLAAALALLTKIVWEWSILLSTNCLEDSPHNRRSRRLALGPLRHLRTMRIMSGCVACLLAALASASAVSGASAGAETLPLVTAVLAATSVLAMLVGEVSERLLYFSSVVYDRMPGTLP